MKYYLFSQLDLSNIAAIKGSERSVNYCQIVFPLPDETQVYKRIFLEYKELLNVTWEQRVLKFRYWIEKDSANFYKSFEPCQWFEWIHDYLDQFQKELNVPEFLKGKAFCPSKTRQLKKKNTITVKKTRNSKKTKHEPSFTILSLARIPEGWCKTISLLKLHLTKRSRQLIFITNVIFIYLDVSRDVFLSDINWLFFL